MSTDHPNGGEEHREQGSVLYGDTHDQLIQGHRYDGIKEYDNPMPGWWVWLFWGSIAFGIFYYAGIYFDLIDSYEEDLAQGQAELAAIREAYAADNPTFEADEVTLAAVIDDADMAAAGAVHYTTYCAACHGDQGQGLIGPNLTDAYWVHGGEPIDVFDVLTNGVVDMGMAAWNNVLSPEERAELVAYIYHDLQGTDPPGAKAPEGELVE